MENLGLGKILGKVLKKGRNKITKYALDIAFAGGVEAGTEWTQYGLGEFNKLLGDGKSKTEALQGSLYRMLTKRMHMSQCCVVDLVGLELEVVDMH